MNHRMIAQSMWVTDFVNGIYNLCIAHCAVVLLATSLTHVSYGCFKSNLNG